VATLTRRVDGPAMSSVAEAVEKVGGIEEEWFFGGAASGFQLAGGASEYPTDGRWIAERSAQQEFRTRLLVVRPREAARFNGTVVVNWNNVSAGESFEPARSAARLVEDGFVLAGVSAQRMGVEGAGGSGAGFHIPALKTDDPVRYGSLEHPGDDYSYDIFTQAAQLLGRDRPGEPDPLPGFEVRRVIATGGSQSGARLMTYYNGVQSLDSFFDGFLLTVSPNAPCAIDAATALDSLPRMGGPNPFALLPWNTYLLRDDLITPIIVLNSEAEACDCYPNSQPDSDHVRVWEIAGAGHAGMLSAEEFAERGAIAGIPHSEICFAAAKRGAIHALHQWVNGGQPPRRQPRIQRRTDDSAFARDDNGNAIGGIRWPDLEAPLSTHRAEPEPGGPPFGLGYSTPFSVERVHSLYPDHAAWFAKYKAAVDHLVDTEVILPDDAADMCARAETTDLPS
jgi:hypothetical protein